MIVEKCKNLNEVAFTSIAEQPEERRGNLLVLLNVILENCSQKLQSLDIERLNMDNQLNEADNELIATIS